MAPNELARIIICCTIALIGMLAMQPLAAQTDDIARATATILQGDREVPRGIFSFSLGPAVAQPPRLTAEPGDWATAVTLDKFIYAYGISHPVTPAEARLCWDEQALYVRFRCANPGPTAFATTRQDQLELLLARDFPRSLDYLRITVPMVKAANGISVVNTPASTKPLEGFTVEKLQQNEAWLAQVTIPWTLLGGKPAGAFGVEIFRNRAENGEFTSPAAMDQFWLHDPALFMEATLGGKVETVSLPGSLAGNAVDTIHGRDAHATGLRRWQTIARLVWPTAEERSAIWTLQQQLDQPTTPATLPARIALAQRMNDLLTLEGFSFVSETTELWWNYRDEYTPSSGRAAVNRALAQGDEAGACKVVDKLLKAYNGLTRSWFADESPGDIRTDTWTTLDRIDKISHKGAEVVLQGYAGKMPVTLTLCCPALGGVRLHNAHTGFFQPQELAKITVKNSTGGTTLITAPDSLITIHRTPAWSITVADLVGKQPRWQLQHGDLLFRFNTDGTVKAVDVKWALQPEEGLYGFGEFFNSLNQRGNIITLWTTNAWDSVNAGMYTTMVYKPIPLIHSTRGYSLFFNTSYRARADVGKTNPQQCRFTTHGPIFDVYIWPLGPEQAINDYSALTGRPLLPPRWAMEHWAGGGSGRWQNNKSQASNTPTDELLAQMKHFADLDIPVAAVYGEGNPSSDAKSYAMLTPQGIKMLTWGRSQAGFGRNRTAPGVAEKDLPFLHDAAGKVLQYPRANLMSGDFPYYDFTDPKVLDQLRSSWRRRLDIGSAGTMLDSGDYVPDNAKFFDGRMGDEMHNFYAYDYHRVFYQLYSEYRGGDFMLFSRSAAPGSQQYTGQFAGDIQSSFPGMALALRGGLNLASCAFPLWGTDIAGYGGSIEQPDVDTYIRWVEWGAFSPLMRVHGMFPREPWYFSEDAVPIYKKFAWVRENFLNYNYSNAVQAHKTGMPLMRALPLAFPEQPELISCTDEYMFGADLLVAPVQTSGDARAVLFPKGRWTNLWSGKTTVGGVTETVAAPIAEIPVFLREGALVPVRISPSFVLGDSLSKGEVQALIVTQPAHASKARCWRDDEAYDDYTSERTTAGMRVQINGDGNTEFLLLYGLTAPVSKITADGLNLPELTGAQTKTLPLGWYQLDAQRTLVRIPHLRKQTVEIELGVRS